MKRIIMIVMVLGIVFVSSNTHAFCMGSGNIMMYPSNSCYEPREPFCLSMGNCSQWDIDRYKREINDYKQCILDYVDAVEADICNMKEKANEAIQEWNNFAR
jgi:hypothetical protein